MWRRGGRGGEGEGKKALGRAHTQHCWDIRRWRSCWGMCACFTHIAASRCEPRELSILTSRPRNCHTSTLLFHSHGGACTVLECPFKSLHHCPYQCFSLFQAATHCQRADCWQRPIAGPTNWNQLQQQAVSWDPWQRYEGLDWASPVQQGPAGEEGWVLHHWSRVTVMDRFREERWWPRFFSCLDSVWKDGHDGRRASKSNSACVRACVCTRARGRQREGERACVRACQWAPAAECWRGCAWVSNGQTEHWMWKVTL